MTVLREALAGQMNRFEDNGQAIQLFLRDDDIDVVEDTLSTLLNVCRHHQAPVNLAVIPGKLTGAGADYLRRFLTNEPKLLELHQHGWMHVNHEPQGRKCEFGASRSFDQQFTDIAAGKARMQEAFGDCWYPVFTPPWNRCNEDTRQALDALDFSVLSTDHPSGEAHRFTEIPVSLDIFRWKGGASLRPAREIVDELIRQMEGQRRIGLLLHHKVMDAAAFDLLNWLLGEVRSYSCVRFEKFATLAEVGEDRG